MRKYYSNFLENITQIYLVSHVECNEIGVTRLVLLQIQRVLREKSF